LSGNIRYRREILWDFDANKHKTIQTKRNIKPANIGNKKTLLNNKSGGLYIAVFFVSSFVFLLLFGVTLGYADSSKENVKLNSEIFVDRRRNTEDLININSDQNQSESITEIETRPISAVITPAVRFRTITVVNGETLSRIASANGVTVDTLYLCNKNLFNNRILRAGMRLQIPSYNGRLIEVRNNDSLNLIAGRYRVNWQAIADANELSSNVIKAGDNLFIPGSQMTAREKEQITEKIYLIPMAGRITSRFGMRSDPITRRQLFHTGLDISANIGTPIKSIADGIVVFRGRSNILGNYLIIRHADGVVSTYAHLNEYMKELNDSVAKGDVVATCGSTGRSTGSHLHIEIHVNGRLVDPYEFLYK